MQTKMIAGFLLALTAAPICWMTRLSKLDEPQISNDSHASSLTMTKLLADPNRVYSGLYNVGDVAVAYGEISAKSGNQRPGITLAFHDWNSAGIEAKTPVLQSFAEPLEGDDVTPLWMIERVARDGGIVALVWEAIGYISEHPGYFEGKGTQPISFKEIFDGEYDDYIRQVATQVKQLGVPVMLSPAGEFNVIGYFGFGPDGNEQVTLVAPEKRNNQYGDPVIPDGPERVRDLYRHVIDIFNEEGVGNVTWFMYSHSAYMNPNDLDQDELAVLDSLHPRYYYPGDNYIDWIGNSAYVSTENQDLNLDYALSHAIEAFSEFTNKPFFIPEFGITTELNQNRSTLIQDIFVRQLPAIPQVRGFAFADADLFELAFATPRLGNFPEEIVAWKKFVSESDDYTNDLNLREFNLSKSSR